MITTLPLGLPSIVVMPLIQQFTDSSTFLYIAQAVFILIAVVETIRRRRAEAIADKYRRRIKTLHVACDSKDDENRALRDANEHLQEKAKDLHTTAEKANGAAKRHASLLSTISHEIRTPLNGIIGLGGLLADTPLNLDQQDLLHSLRECSDGLLLIVNDVLDFSKIDAGKLDLEFKPFDLIGCLQSACHLMDFNASPKGIQLTQRVAEGTPRFVMGDVHRLRQVLHNVLGNAVKFTDHGTVDVRVKGEEAKAQDGSDAVRITFEVEDSGIGIPEDAIGRLFQSFFRSNNSGSYGGTGLGLAISKRLVELMDPNQGRMWATSTLGKGSTFYISMVFKACNPADAMGRGLSGADGLEWIDRHHRESPPIAPAADDGSDRPLLLAEKVPLQILVAEDNVVNQKLALRLLKKLGYHDDQVTLVEDGQQAINAVLERAYDIVLMDVQMPNVSGIEATKVIRSDPSIQQREIAPVILALTANAMEADRQKCLTAGMNGHIAKPVKLETLSKMIEAHGSEILQRKAELASPIQDFNHGDCMSDVGPGSVVDGIAHLPATPCRSITAANLATYHPPLLYHPLPIHPHNATRAAPPHADNICDSPLVSASSRSSSSASLKRNFVSCGKSRSPVPTGPLGSLNVATVPVPEYGEYPYSPMSGRHARSASSDPVASLLSKSTSSSPPPSPTLRPTLQIRHRSSSPTAQTLRRSASLTRSNSRGHGGLSPAASAKLAHYAAAAGCNGRITPPAAVVHTPALTPSPTPP